MKVLTIREPFATLISQGIKRIETRSWKTKYRGELYIHAGVAKIDKKKRERKDLMDLVDESKLNYGSIICKCELVDCIYMTEDFIEKIKKKKNEYVCGNYEVGRYAWILKNIEILDKPIPAKGQLGMWNYNNN